MVGKQVGVLLILFLFPFLLFSQNVRHLSVDEGLPQSFVSGIIEDNDGFIWIGTRNGLARYDGHRFKIFQSSFNGKNTSLASNVISHIRKENDNSMWIMYEGGEIDRFDFTTEKPTHVIISKFIEQHKLKINRRVWMVTSDNTFWFKASSGMLLSTALNNTDVITDYSGAFGENNPVYNLLEDKNKKLWVLSQQALNVFNPKTKKFTSIPIPYDIFKGMEIKKIKENFAAFCQRNNGELMWADKEYLYFFNPEKQSFRRIKLIAETNYGPKWIDVGDDGIDYFMSDKTVYSYSDALGIIPQAIIELRGNRQAQAFITDQSGLFWVGSDAEGIYTIDTRINFKSFDYEDDFVIDLLKDVYGIDVVDFFNWRYNFVGVLQPSYSLRSQWNNDKHWLALNRTVGYFDTKLNKAIKLPELPSQEKTWFVPITGISVIRNGNPVVVDKNNSIYIYDDKDNKWEFILSLDTLNPTFPKKIQANNLYADKDTNILWITTEAHGLLKVSLADKSIKQIQSSQNGLPTNNLINVLPDFDDNKFLWLGSSSGLIKFHKTTGQCEVFSVKEGLPDNMIYSMQADALGNLWLGTNKGLVCFNTNNYNTRAFTRNHGLNNIEFNRHHELMLKGNEMAFGGVKSGVIFSPELIKTDTFSPDVTFTGIKLNNENIYTIKPNIGVVKGLQNLELPYNENTIAFAYTALQFNQPQDIKYRYRLLGYDDNWVTAGNKREAVYTKLPPGKYTFEVNASNTTGTWSNHIKSLKIKITPPWWKTWWAMLLYLLIGICALVWFFNFKVRQQMVKNEIRLKSRETKELRRLDKVKTRFFSNIAHEFRTPLSLILGPAEQLTDKVTAEDNKLLEIIKKNTVSLIQLTDQLLDIAKLEAGVLKPQMVWGDIVPVIVNITGVFAEEAAVKKVTIKLEAPESAEFLFSINTLDRILYNLLSNALKFTQEGDTITVTVIKDETGLILKVKDTGRGIPEEEQSSIFNRYYKADNQNPLQGTGIGLSLVGELVELHKGTIKLESSTKVPTGTTFTIHLPFAVQEKVKVETVPQTENTENKPTVLVVEDHDELVKFISESLQDKYNVLIARNGKEGLSTALESAPDLIVSDVSMEQMNGFEFCKAVREDINISHIPVILLTAKADMDSRLEGLSFGANDYVTKPFSISELKLRIKNLLELQRKQRDRFHDKFSNIIPSEDVENDVLQNEFLDKIHIIIEDNLDNKNFSVDELATSLFMSRANLHRKLKMMFNLPASEIIKVYRLKKAAQLLKQNYNATEVAYMTGFNTPSYFSKCFKDYYKITPAKYAEK
ncbi:ATP-binding protein [Flavobacterium sp. ST-75]|uniref:histidine kinase n=1 Tax=Flavobacterium rhizophilum TaxID=3163296 RepID=A0ABW8YGF2_9FLAO